MGFFSFSDAGESVLTEEGEKHPAFDPLTLSYDFQVVKLQTAVTQYSIVPLNSDANRPASTGELIVVLGIGDNQPGPSQASATQVLGAIVNIESNAECMQNKGLGVSYSDSIDESMICAIRNKSDQVSASGANACDRDNGGPLIASDFSGDNPPDYVGDLIGVVSW